MTETGKIAEIEVVVTAEISFFYHGDELEYLEQGELIPDSPEKLAVFKRDVANDVTSELIASIGADHVNITNVQYFEKEHGADEPCEEEDGE